MKRLISVCTALMLVLSAGFLIPASTIESYAFAGGRAAGTAMTQDAPWYDSIPEMLAAGEYEEGVVIAGIDMSKAKRTGDPGSALEAGRLRSAADEIMTVDLEEVSAQQDFLTWLSRLKNKITGQHDDSVCITSIRRSDMTTKQILRLLASDDSVVFAEPNYIMDLDAEEDDPAPAESEDTDDKATESVGNAGGDNTLLKDAEPAAKAAEADDETPAEEVPAAKAAEADDETPAEEVPVGKAGGTDGNASYLQWSSDENTDLHAADKNKDVSVKVPGWPDDSNMDHEVIVAVLDMPVDFENPDLADRAYTFTPALRKELGCDEHGFNALWDSKDGKLVYEKDADHGSHVAGIIGASWDGKGISGVASNVKIISVQNSLNRYTSLVDSLRGYSFISDAVKHGVDIRVINNSWGLNQSSKAIDAAVTELGEQGVVSIFAAGNAASDLNDIANIGLLANNPYVIIVASTTPSGELADSSCYGKGIVTLGAPGAGIFSCLQVSSARYMPFMAKDNKFYENFEAAEPGTWDNSSNSSVRITQIGYTDVDGEPVPAIDREISGAEASVVSGDSAMGFEGSHVLKLKFDRSELGGWSGSNVAVKMEFSNAADLGVKVGDIVGFAYGGKEEFEPILITDADSGDDPQFVILEKNNRNCWNTASYTIPERKDSGQSDGKLTVVAEILAKKGDEIYFDAVGIGREDQKQPYGFKSGTSMACPAVSGAAAVLASRHFSELRSGDSASAEKLANYIRSSVRPLLSLQGITSTGGIIDLTVDAAASDSLQQPGPDITDLTLSGTEVTLTGKDFGSTQGTAAVRKYVTGGGSDIGASVASWSDNEAVLELDEDFEGIIEVVLTASNGKHDTIVKYISKSSNIFEREHTLPGGTGDPLAIDEEKEDRLGDYETSGLLTPADDKLYYMPYIGKVENNPACRSLYCYDPDKDIWTKCPEYPAWIRDVSGAWLDGKLYVKGTLTDVDDSGTIPYYEKETIEPGTTCIYSYTPGESSWKKCSVDGVASEYTLIAGAGKLMLAGVSQDELYDAEDDSYPTIRDYDPASGASGKAIYSSCPQANPKAVYAGGYVYCFEYYYTNHLYAVDVSGSSGGSYMIELPEFYHTEKDIEDDEEYLIDMDSFALASYDDTIILTGPPSMDGSTDTYILKAGEKSLKPYSKRVSDGRVLMPSAAMPDGRLYVIGGSIFEPGKRIFRSTQITDPVTEKFTITYDLNGGSWNGSTADITEKHANGTVITIHEAPVRDGYIFSYWKGSEYQPGDEYTVTEDHTFTAQWEKDEEAVSDDGTDSGSGSSGGKVRTGDTSHMGIWIAVALLAAIEMAVLVYVRSRPDRRR